MPLFLMSFMMNNKPLLSQCTDIDQKEKIRLDELFEAYADCRANKRNTMNALSFEVDYGDGSKTGCFSEHLACGSATDYVMIEAGTLLIKNVKN